VIAAYREMLITQRCRAQQRRRSRGEVSARANAQ
jgi:hypothetical protein